MNVERFVKALSSLDFENTFNPYSDRCLVYDYFDAPKRRRARLKKLLLSAQSAQLDAIWVARDLGYRGGRRTGLAMTDDVHYSEHLRRWGLDEVKHLTKGEALPERTAAVIWRALAQIQQPVFLWNVFPLHPHEPERPFSNRSHNAAERDEGSKLLMELIKLLAPKRIVTIGNDAGRALSHLEKRYQIVNTRHPSYGGQSIFLSQISELYGLD